MQKAITAREFMRRELVTMSPDSSVLDGVALLLKENISGAPVVEAGNRYLGVFSEKCCIHALTNLVGAARESGKHVPAVHEFMNRNVITLRPETDVFDAIDHLIERRISGAPVVDRGGRYLGIFSEKTAMQVVVGAVYDQVPGGEVSRFMNLDRNRLIDRDASLLDAARVFVVTPFRRLPVLVGDALAGQVSRRDVLRSAYECARDSTAGDDSSMDPCCRFRSGTIVQYMDTQAMTKGPNADMLEIAEAFLNSPYRRLPILENGTLIGQVSRRDLLEVASKALRPEPKSSNGPQPLYLSAVTDSVPPAVR